MRAKGEHDAIMDKEKDVPYGTRYPQEVFGEMHTLAKEHGRSFNGEIVWALREYIKQQRGENKHADHKKDQA